VHDGESGESIDRLEFGVVIPTPKRLLLGPPKSRQLNEPIRVSLDDLVPPNHFYRHLDRSLDLAFVRDLVRGAYAETGRPSIDPVVFFKLQLILFSEGIRSERQPIAIASLNLAHRWYLGYRLDEDLPDHSSLTRIRERLGLPASIRNTLKRIARLGIVGQRCTSGRRPSQNSLRVRAARPVPTVAQHTSP